MVGSRASLADSFLADFASDDEDEEDEEQLAYDDADQMPKLEGAIGSSSSSSMSGAAGSSGSMMMGDDEDGEGDSDSDSDEDDTADADGLLDIDALLKKSKASASAKRNNKSGAGDGFDAPTTMDGVSQAGVAAEEFGEELVLAPLEPGNVVRRLSRLLASGALAQHLRRIRDLMAASSSTSSSTSSSSESDSSLSSSSSSSSGPSESSSSASSLDSSVKTENGQNGQQQQSNGGGDQMDQKDRDALDHDRENPVILRSNELVGEIEAEIAGVHKYLRDLYSKKYQELEPLVPDPVQYAKVIQVIGNETDIANVADLLGTIVPQQTVLTISVTSTTTAGRPLPPAELKQCFQACQAILDLDRARAYVLRYIEARMGRLAPNLAALIGSAVAARMLAQCGGLPELAAVPACNLQVVGAERKALDGFAVTRAQQHAGLLALAPIVQAAPLDLRPRMLRTLSGKAALAARVDVQRGDPSGGVGRHFLEGLQTKLRKWMEPPPAKLHKALPKPNLKPGKRRGGRRHRRWKERMRISELEKKKHRMVFGVQEVTDDFTGEGYGLLGQAGSGQLLLQSGGDFSGSLADQARMTRAQRAKMARIRRQQSRLRPILAAAAGSGSGTGTSTNPVNGGGGVAGTASSIAFSTVEGLELVDHSRAGKTKLGQKYFEAGTSFRKVGEKASASQQQPQMDAGGFAIPQPKRPKTEL